MIYKVYCMHDDAAGIFLQPNSEATDDVAIRNFDYACAKNEVMAFRPSDFSLWCIGEFDDQKGTLQYFDPQKIKQATKRSK